MAVGPLRLPSGQIVDDSHNIEELFADTFPSVFVGDVLVEPALYQIFNETMAEHVITVDKVCMMLQGLDGDSAVQPDYVHLLVLKSCTSQIAVPLTVIFNRSLATGMLPVMWLESVVIPLFKAKSRYDLSNYRPVSFTSECCKTMERVLASKLIYSQETNSLLSERQFGFRKSRSTEDQLLLVYSEIAGLVDRGWVVDMVMLDFSKAFEVVSHVVLLDKLREIGVCTVLLN